MQIELPAPVNGFLDAIASRNADQVGEWLTDDAEYHFTVPRPPVIGREAVVAAFAGILGEATRVQWDVLSAFVSGSTVWAERVDRFWYDGNEAVVPCVGIMQMRDGRISSVRDYLDQESWRASKESAVSARAR